MTDEGIGLPGRPGDFTMKDMKGEERVFECRRCGNCCAVRGYVRLNDEDIDAISEYLGISVYDFTKSYTRLIRNRQQLTLIERSDGACVFLQEDRTCLVNEVKPRQCRDFPQKWRYDGYEEMCEGGRKGGGDGSFHHEGG
ncbi:MAG: YkgJ family cysteine cluster protein [Kiritimatiellae bacterium]|nr:YkgJ family cysteine cluster protein [Kiritimatiellia bacterium]